MTELITQTFDTADFPARWQCGNWSDLHGWTHIVADVGIFGAYTAIPCVLGYFILRRRDVPFLPIFWLFVAFIFACGFGHLVEASIFFQPWYRFSGLIKVITAVVSWATVIALIPIVPKALSLPGLAAVNARLASEIAERQRAELELRLAGDELELRVQERTAELAQANQTLLQEIANRKRTEEELRQKSHDLAEFNRLAVGREERMIELKRRINELARQAGIDAPYDLSFADGSKDS